MFYRLSSIGGLHWTSRKKWRRLYSHHPTALWELLLALNYHSYCENQQTSNRGL